MKSDELVEVLVRVNSQRPKPVDEQLLREIIALVVKHPLEDDRSSCQQQISELLAQRMGAIKDVD